VDSANARRRELAAIFDSRAVRQFQASRRDKIKHFTLGFGCKP
jgi:hypothetical protein